MKKRSIILILPLAVLTLPALRAQPYHNDTVVGGVQTLEVEGDLAIKQYGGGVGGNLSVVGDTHFSAGGVVLSGMPSHVTGTYYGTQKLGTFINTGEYVFEATGDDTTADFVVPLGRFGDWYGTAIQLDIQTGMGGPNNGAAHFTLMGKRYDWEGVITAVSHRAYGGGGRVKIHGLNIHGFIHLYLEFDATTNSGVVENFHRVIVRAQSIGSISPETNQPFEALTPVKLMDSMVSDHLFGNSMSHSLNAENLILGGKVTLSLPQGDISMGIYE